MGYRHQSHGLNETHHHQYVHLFVLKNNSKNKNTTNTAKNKNIQINGTQTGDHTTQSGMFKPNRFSTCIIIIKDGII